MDIVFDRKASTITLSEGNRRATSSSSWYAGAQCSAAYKTTGKWYFEAMSAAGGLNEFFGLSPALCSTSDTAQIPGSNIAGVGFRGDASTVYTSSFGTNHYSLSTWSDGDTIGFILDFDNKKIWISINGVVNGGGNPLTGTLPFQSGFTGGGRPSFGIATSGTITLNILPEDLSYIPPEGFHTLDYIAPYDEVAPDYPLKTISYAINPELVNSSQEKFPIVLNIQNSVGVTGFNASPVFKELSGGKDDYTKLLIHGDEPEGSTALSDSSSSAHTITTVGDAQTVGFNSEDNEIVNHSVYLPGSSSYFYVPTGPNFAFGTADFCVEMYFMKVPQVNSSYLYCSRGNGASSSNTFRISLSGTNQLSVEMNGSNYIQISSALVDYRWTHIAVSSNSGLITLWVDGISKATYENSFSFVNHANRPVFAANGYQVSSNPLPGHMAGIAVHKGVPVYTEEFEPPKKLSEMSKTLDTILFLDFLEVDQGEVPGTFTDSSWHGNDVTNDDCEGCTFWWDAISLGGSTDYYHTPNSDDFNWGVANEASTFDVWIYPTDSTGISHGIIVSQTETNSDYTDSIYLTVYDGGAASAGKVRFIWSKNSSTQVSLYSNAVIKYKAWNHIELTNDGAGNFVIYINGVNEGSIYQGSLTTLSLSSIVCFGALYAYNPGTENFQGYQGEPHFSKGIARHTTTFVPPEKPYRHSWERIHVTDTDGNDLYCELEDWDVDNKKATIHVAPPILSDGSDGVTTQVLLSYDGNNTNNAVYWHGGIDGNTLICIQSPDTESDGSTNIVDSSPKNVSISVTSDVHHETDQSYFGDTSFRFETTGRLNFTTTAIGLGDYTLSFWVRFDNVTPQQNLVTFNGTGVVVYQQGGQLFYFIGGNLISSGVVISNTTWTHIAICRSSNVTKMFIQGVQRGISYTDNNSFTNGAWLFGNASFSGYVEELFISADAKWTANFVPPEIPWSDDEIIPYIGTTGIEYVEVTPRNLLNNSSHPPVVISQSSYWGSSAGWQCFTESIGNVWVTNTGAEAPCWIRIDFGSVLDDAVVKYDLRMDTNVSAGRVPKTWTLQGSFNATAWFTVDTVASETGWSDNEVRTYYCDDISTPYRYYRLYITANNGDGSYTQIDEIYLFVAEGAAKNVWDENFVFVSHQAQDPSGTAPQILDSTARAKHGTSYGTMLTEDLIDGVTGKMLDYDGTDDYTNHGYDAAHDITDTLTLEVSFTPNTLIDSSITNYPGFVARHYDPTDSEDTYGLFINTSGLLHLGSNGGSIQSTRASWVADTNFIVAGTYNATGLVGDLFVDGVKEFLTTDSYNTMAGSVNNLVIGKYRDTLDFFPGAIGEVRISNIVRSDDWIYLTNLSLKDQLCTVSEYTGLLVLPFEGRYIPGYINFPKPYNINFMNDFRPNSVIRLKTRENFFRAF